MGFYDPQPLDWKHKLPAEQWQEYRNIIQRAHEHGIKFAMGGAFAVAAYTGRWRDTKDLDFYVLPEDKDRMIEVVTQAGFSDYYPVLAYDPGWIYRAYQGDTIADIIWAMANRRAYVDETWIEAGKQVEIRGEHLHVIPAEEMIWGKIYIMQKTRCDWTDIFNIIYAVGIKLDWQHLIQRLGPDLPLLRGVLSVFSWLSPQRSQVLPAWLWAEVGLPQPEPVDHGEELMIERANLMDSRPWYIPAIPPE